MIVLDTDVLVDILRKYPPAQDWLESLGNTILFLPGYVIMELIQGCRNKAEKDKIEKFIKKFQITWPSSETCNKALSIFSCYHLSHGLGLLDALIGQTSVSLNAPLCTFNQKHYAIIPNLETIQPYKKSSL